jgi:hypothetical protein
MQVGWLAIQVIARAIQHLEVTLLEVTTLSFVICAIGTFAAWYRKPYDVQTYILLETEIAVEDVDLRFTDKDGNQRDLLQDYRAAHPSSNVVDDQGEHIPPYSKLAMIDDGLTTYTSAFTDLYGDYWGRKPYDPDRIRNDRLPVMEKHVTVICALTTAAYAAYLGMERAPGDAHRAAAVANQCSGHDGVCCGLVLHGPLRGIPGVQACQERGYQQTVQHGVVESPCLDCGGLGVRLFKRVHLDRILPGAEADACQCLSAGQLGSLGPSYLTVVANDYEVDTNSLSAACNARHEIMRVQCNTSWKVQKENSQRARLTGREQCRAAPQFTRAGSTAPHVRALLHQH